MKAATRMLNLALACAIPALGGAQEPTANSATSKFRDPDDGKFDISTYLATPKRFLPVPIVITEPAIGYGGGIAGMFIRPRKQAGSEGFARPNISHRGRVRHREPHLGRHSW